MKKIKSISIFITLMLLMGITSSAQNNPDKKEQKGFALLELFTSEGCSSCPLADELMGKIQNEYKDNNLYVLAYHVDYWDKQGWKDIFSNPDYTQRQYEYAKFLGKEPVYTPQLIVNGKADYIASQETVVRNAIKTALSKPAVANLTLEASEINNSLSVKYTIEEASKNSRLLIAVVQKAAKSDVKRGENAHRILSHYQIVHHLHTINLNKDKSGIAIVHLPNGFDTKDWEIIGFVQDRNDGIVLGANKAIFQEPSL